MNCVWLTGVLLTLTCLAMLIRRGSAQRLACNLKVCRRELTTWVAEDPLPALANRTMGQDSRGLLTRLTRVETCFSDGLTRPLGYCCSNLRMILLKCLVLVVMVLIAASVVVWSGVSG